MTFKVSLAPLAEREIAEFAAYAAGTGSQADLNLGIATFVNGSAKSPIATDIFAYVVTGHNGMTST